MNLSLNGIAEKLITDRINSGQYATPEDVINAALGALECQESFGDFAPGELDRLIAEGLASGPPLDGETVLRELRDLRHTRTRKVQ